MFIIIEGADASGKSTLIEAVETEIRSRYPHRPLVKLHKGRPEQESRRWVIKDYVLDAEKIDLDKVIVLADRWHWGEGTYAPLKRPHTDTDGFGLLGAAGWRWVELFLRSRGAARYWLYQPSRVVRARLSERGDDYVQADELSSIIRLYKKVHRYSGNTVKLQPSPDSLHEVPKLAKWIVDDAEKKAATVADIRRFKHYIGGPRPKVLVLGDERNHNKWYGAATSLPFIPVDGNSGNYLMSALRDPFWQQAGIVNINDDPESFAALWEALGFPPIVVLGRLAEKTLVGLGFEEHEYAVLPHPQFVKRFFNRRKRDYGKAIARISKGVGKNKREADKWILQ
jgi:hypothetical protein